MLKKKKYGKAFKIFMSPQGKTLTQDVAQEIAKKIQESEHVMFFAARYEGIDQRAHEEYADLELSIGDYVLMGGDLPTMVTLEAVTRYLPGVVGKSESVEKDSFSGPFVDHPAYTVHPHEWKGKVVPEILRSGNHGAIDSWRKDQAVSRSVVEHFSWVRSHCTDVKDKELVAQKLPNHYVALMHDDVIIQGKAGTSSVTSIDIHDIARSSKTYGIKNYFLVTPLKDQQKIVNKVLGFWETSGVTYNNNRSRAVGLVKLQESLDQVLKVIEEKEGQKPLIIATSAKNQTEAERITYFDQHKVFAHNRPVLFLFGTADGLTSELISRCDYLLLPVGGFSEFKHLSVRSAVAIILDRWLGIHLIKSD